MGRLSTELDSSGNSLLYVIQALNTLSEILNLIMVQVTKLKNYSIL